MEINSIEFNLFLKQTFLVPPPKLSRPDNLIKTFTVEQFEGISRPMATEIVGGRYLEWTS